MERRIVKQDMFERLSEQRYSKCNILFKTLLMYLLRMFFLTEVRSLQHLLCIGERCRIKLQVNK